MARLATLLVLVLASTAAVAQTDEQARAAEQRALDAERRAVAAERRALEAERRALEADRTASSGSSAQSDIQAQACQAAASNYQIACSVPSRDPLWETPQCTIAQAEVRKRCYAGQ